MKNQTELQTGYISLIYKEKVIQMEAMAGIMARIKEMTGIEVAPQSMSDEEYTRFKCDSYNNSVGNLNETDGFNCEKCKNKGYIAKPMLERDSWYEIHCECSCQRTRKAIIRLMKSGLKNIIKDYTFNKYEAEEEWQRILKGKAIEYAKNPNNAWFFIGGQVGCGKTHLCTAVSGAFLKQGKNVRYMLWRDDVTKLKSNVTDAQAYEELVTSYKTADVLYIDDLFKNGKGNDGRVQPPTGADIQVAFEILNYRYNNKALITIISSERSINELVDIDEATASRISEMSFGKGYGFNVRPDKAKNHRLKNISDL